MRWRTRNPLEDRCSLRLSLVATGLLLHLISGASGDSSQLSGSAASPSSAAALDVSEGSGNGLVRAETRLSSPTVAEDESDAQDSFAMELLSAVELHLGGDEGSKGRGSVAEVALDNSENIEDEQLLEVVPENDSASLSTSVEGEPIKALPPASSETSTSPKSSTTITATSDSPDVTATPSPTTGSDVSTEAVPVTLSQEASMESSSTVVTSAPSTTESAPSTDFTATTETVGEARSSDSTPLSEEASEAAGPTPPSDGTGTTASDDYSSTPEDVSSWRSAGITTGITTPSDETGDTLPPWTPEPSFETPTGRPLRKSSRRGDPDIHTVLNNILSIIGGNVRVRGQPAPSLQPPASGSNRINNRGPPQFVAGTGPGPLPPPRPLVGGLPPTQVAPPPRRKTTSERVPNTAPAGLVAVAGSPTVSPTPVLTSSDAFLRTSGGSDVSQTPLSSPSPTREVTKAPSSALPERDTTSMDSDTTNTSPIPTRSTTDNEPSATDRETTTTDADIPLPPTIPTSVTSAGATTVESVPITATGDEKGAKTTPSSATYPALPSPTDPSNISETESSGTAKPIGEPARSDPTDQPTDTPATTAVASLSALLGTSSDPDTSSAEETSPKRPFMPVRPASIPPLTSRPRRPLRPASSSRPASLFERLRESMKPTAATASRPPQRRPWPPPADETDQTTGDSRDEEETTVSWTGTSESADMLAEDSMTTFSVGTESPLTTQMEVQTTAPWEITTETTPGTTEEGTAASEGSDNTVTDQPTGTPSPADPDSTTTAATADTSPPPAPSSLGVGTAVAVSAEDLVRPASPPSRWPNGRPGMTSRPRPPAATPPLAAAGRPGLVLDAAAPHRPAGVRPDQRRPEPVILTAPTPAVGDVIDVTVSAVHGLGTGPPPPPPPSRQPTRAPTQESTQPSASTGQPYVIPVDINELRQPGGIITRPNPSDSFVSIDGRRTYFNLEPTDVDRRGSYQTVGAGVGFAGQAVPQPPGAASPSWGGRPSSGGSSPSPGERRSDRPVTRPGSRPGQKTGSPYPGLRRRPSPPPVRIDTCIVGDDSTCKKAFNERCLTEDGVSSCVCRPGYSRLRPRTVCKRVVSVVMSVKVDGVDGQRLSWDSDFSDPQTEAFQQLAWDAKNAINSAMTQTTMKDIYMGNAVNSFYSLGGRLILNTTVSLLDTPQTRLRQVKTELQRQMLRVIKAKDNNIGDSTLFVEGPLNPIPGVQDLNECSAPELHDCDENAVCSNVFGTFLCRCRPGFDDRYRSDVARAGRACASCSDDYCGGHGTCQISDGVKTCLCRGSYYGARCDIDGEVLGAALGATAAAALVIIATFVGLCQWSKRWHKGRGRSKLELGTMGAANTFNFVKPGPGGPQPAYALGMDERMQWGRPGDSMGHQNIYAPEPMMGAAAPRSHLGPYGSREQALYGSQVPLYGPKPTGQDGPASLNITAGRTSYPAHIRRARTPGALSERAAPSRGSRTPVPLPDYDDDEREERQSTARGYPPVPRPRSRGSVANQSLVYYDIHDFEQRETLRGPGRGPPPMSTYSSRTSNYFR